MRSKSCLLRNLLTTSAPNVNDTPLSFSPHPITSLSGSDHNKSHNKPKTDKKHLKLVEHNACVKSYKSSGITFNKLKIINDYNYSDTYML